MLIDAFRHVSFYLIHTDQIGQEEVCDQKGHQPEDNDLHRAFPDLVGIPGHLAQLPLFDMVAVQPVFDLPEHHLHENGLRAGPSAEDPSENHGKEDDEDYEREHPEHEDEEVFRTEDLAEQDEFSLQDVDHEQRLTLDLDEGKTEKEDQIEDTRDGSLIVEAAFGLFRGDIIPGAFFVDRGHGVAEGLIHLRLFGQGFR